MTKFAYVIRHVAFEDLGSWQEVIGKNFIIRYFDAGYNDLSVIDKDEPDLLIILGGPIGVYDEADYPFLITEKLIIKKRITNKLPTLGVCLGAQLIASAMGARVYKGHIKEIGWSSLKFFHNYQSAYFKHLADTKVLHWHGDTFELPNNAILHASSSLYPNQAFTINNHVLAIQFHPEITELGMERWFIGHSSEILHNQINLKELRNDTKKYASQLAKKSQLFLEAWINTFK